MLRDRLDAFADRDPACELVDGLVARGIDRATAVEEVVGFMSAFDGPGEAHKAAVSLVWTLQMAAEVLGGMVTGPR